MTQQSQEIKFSVEEEELLGQVSFDEIVESLVTHPVKPPTHQAPTQNFFSLLPAITHVPIHLSGQSIPIHSPNSSYSSPPTIPNPSSPKQENNFASQSFYLSDTFKVEAMYAGTGADQVAEGGKAKRIRRNTISDPYHSDKQLFLFPVTSQKVGANLQLTVLFKGEKTSKCTVIFYAPIKPDGEKSKKKSTLDPFSEWPDENPETMEWDKNHECFTATLRTKVLTTNNQIFILRVLVQVEGSAPQIIEIPMGIPSRADQVETFVKDLLIYHKRAMNAAKCTKEQIRSWFKPVLRNSWNLYLKNSPVHLDPFQLDQGFERRRGFFHFIFSTIAVTNSFY